MHIVKAPQTLAPAPVRVVAAPSTDKKALPNFAEWPFGKTLATINYCQTEGLCPGTPKKMKTSSDFDPSSLSFRELKAAFNFCVDSGFPSCAGQKAFKTEPTMMVMMI